MDLNKHKFLMLQILKDIYSDIELANALGFKGGTALMFFYNLNRFSVDLDFNLIATDKEEHVYQKIRSILLKYGTIFDEAKKYFGPIIVLNYGVGERKLKVEISNRQFDNHYERKNLLGINMKVMVASDMFAHKLCALLDRNELTNRDIFDTHFFLTQRTSINRSIVETRMNMPFDEYIEKCIACLENTSDKGMLNGLGELMDEESKKFVRTKLRVETIDLLRFFKEFPIIA
jgi:predicted nucleotidyltransferase component of viral defense system